MITFAIAPAQAGKVSFSPQAFQVFGNIDSGTTRPARARLSSLPDELRSRTISFDTGLAPGSIIVRTGKRRLYYVLPDGKAIEYKVGVGKEGFTWSGTNRISRKAEWPDWRPPREMILREAKRGRKIPAFMPGGPDNPLGARALYIGDTEFRIHGTTQPGSIGRAMSSGCIRMMNEEVIDLYERVKVGALVVVED
ncbi:MAG: L,D-transpeptidase [Alphaproteobacteria bacterium]|nr:L,D-transpeptidase [Alphaproteobacteria bacterium]